MSKLSELLEKSAIHEFLHFMNAFEYSKPMYPPYAFLPRNSPDCVLNVLDMPKSWIEETEVFSNYFKGESPSVGTKDNWHNERYFDVPKNTEEYTGKLIQSIRHSMKKKDNNPDYEKHTSKWGKGILLIKIDCPYFNWNDHLEIIKNADNYADIQLNNFVAVYLAVFPMYRMPSFLTMQWPRPSLLICGAPIDFSALASQ